MTAIKWKTGTTADWNVASNWSPGAVPGASDAVTINAAGSYAVFIDDAESAASVLLNSASATLLVEGGPGVALTLGTSLTANAGTLSLVADDTSSYGSITGGTVTVNTGASLFAQSFMQDPSFSSFEIDSAVNIAGKAVIASDTDLLFVGGGSLTGSFSGPGEITLTSAPFSGVHQNYASSTAALSSLGTVTLDNYATLKLAATTSGTVAASLNGSDYATLTTSANSTLSVSGTLDFNYDAHVLLGTGSKVTLSNSVQIDNSAQIYVPATTNLSLSGEFDAGIGSLFGFGDTEFDTVVYGGGTLTTTGHTVVADPGSGQDELFVGEGLTWSNTGTVELFGHVAMNPVASDHFTFVNGAGGVFNLETEDAGLIQHDTDGTDLLTNAGTIGRGLDPNENSDTGTSTIAAAVNSTGTIDVEDGTLAFTSGGTLSGVLSGAGTLLLYAGSYTVGALSGGGHLALGPNVTLNGSPVISSAVTLDANQTLAVASGNTLTLAGPFTIADSTGSGTLAGAGQLITSGTTTITDLGYGGLAVSVEDNWTNSGTVNDGGFGFLDQPGGGAPANIVNTGTFDFVGDDSSLMLDTRAGGTPAGTFTSTGTLAKTSGVGVNTIAGRVIDTGITNVVASGTLALTGGGVIGGTLNGGMLELGGGAFATAGLGGGGLLDVNNASLTGTATGIIASGFHAANAGTVSVASGKTLTLSGPVGIGDSTGGAVVFSGPGTLATSGVTTINDLGYGGLALNVAGNWANAGTVNDDGFGYFDQPGGGAPGSIVNTGTFNFASDDASLMLDTRAGGTPAGTLTSTGTLAKTGGTGTSTVAARVLDTGSTNVATGTLALTGGGAASGTLTGAGVLDLGGGAFTTAGLAGNGTLAVTGATLTASATSTITASVHAAAYGTIAVATGKTLALSGPVGIGDATGGAVVFNGPGTLATSGTTTINDLGYGGLALNVADSWANSGTVNDYGFGYFDQPGGGAPGTITNTGTFNFASDDASLMLDTRAGGSPAGTLTSTGMLAKTGGTGISTIAGRVLDTGFTSIATGTLALTGGGAASGTLTGAGVLDLGGGAFTTTGLSGSGTLAVIGASLASSASVTIADALHAAAAGTLTVGAKTLTLTGPVSIGDATGGAVVFNGAGTLATSGVTTINDLGYGGLVLNVADSWANNGTVYDGGYGLFDQPGGGSPGVLLNSGTFDLTSDDAGFQLDTRAGGSPSGRIANTGTLAKTGGTGTSTIGVAINSTGSLGASSGTLALTGGGTLSGAIVGAGVVELASGTTTTTGLSGAGHLAITGGNTTLTQTASGTIAAALLASGNGTLVVAPRAATLTLPGQVTLGDATGYGAFSGPGTIATTGIGTVFDGGANVLEMGIGLGLTWNNSGTINDAGLIASGTGGSTIVNSGTIDLTSDDAGLTDYAASASFTNTGLLAKTGGTGTSTLNIAFADTGTIAVNTGTLALMTNATLGGTLTGAGDLSLAYGTFTTTGLSGAGTLLLDSAGGYYSVGTATLVDTGNVTITDTVIVEAYSTIAPAAGKTVTLTGPVQFGAGGYYARLVGAGTITTTNATLLPDMGAGTVGVLADGGVTWTNSGTIGLGSVAYVGPSSTIANLASGVFDLTTDDASITYASNPVGQFNNAGLLAKTGGTATSTIAAAISNTGTIEAANGTLSLTGAVTGAGAMRIDAGATLDVASTPPASQQIAFTGGAGATLKLETPGSIGTLTNFTAGDRLDLASVSVTGASVSGNTLSVTTSGGTYTYVSAGIAHEVAALSDDGAGGTTVSLYRGAIPTHTPDPLAFGNFHVGSTTGTAAVLTVTNNAPADGYSENLNAGFGGASAGFSATGTATGIAAGAGSGTSLAATIDTSTAGARSGTATLTLASNGAGIDGRGTTPLASQTVNLTGAVYNYAAAGVAGTTLNLGVIHAGTAASGALTLTNIAPGGGYSEALDAGLSGTTAGLSASGSITGLGAGSTDGSTLVLTVDTGTSGAYGGTALLGLVSDGNGIDGLGTTTLAGQTITVQATVDNYAVAALEDPSGPALSGTSTSETLNLGSVAQGGAALSATIGALNAAGGTADLLGGTFSSAGGAGFTNSGFGSFGGLSAGQDEHAQTVSLSTGAAGTFSETVVLSGYGTNASGYYGALAAETLTIIGTVTASSYTTYTLASGPNVVHGADGLGDLFIASAASINSGDQLTGGNGANTLSLAGAGTFNLNAPSVLANIPVIDGVEGQAGTGGKKGKPDTRQTIRLRNSTTETLTIAAGTPAAGNKSPEAVNVTAGTGTYTINLAGGADAVTLGAGPATVTLGGAANSVAGGSGTALVRSTASFAGAAVVGASGAALTLEVTGGGNATLNAADTNLRVQLDAAGTLKLSALAFITAVGSSGADTLTALGGTQTLTGGLGADTLIGYTGGNDNFADTAAGLNGDLIKNWTTGDVIDVKDFSAAGLAYASNTLTISNGGTNSAIKFSAGLALHNFTVVGSDGNGGTLIGYHS